VENLKNLNNSSSKDNILKLRLTLTQEKAIEFVKKLKDMNLGFAALFLGLVPRHSDFAD
jgi:hypothetical protein